MTDIELQSEILQAVEALAVGKLLHNECVTQIVLVFDKFRNKDLSHFKQRKRKTVAFVHKYSGLISEAMEGDDDRYDLVVQLARTEIPYSNTTAGVDIFRTIRNVYEAAFLKEE